MKPWLKHPVQALVLSAPLFVFQACEPKTNGSNPIVDIRFDAPYHQIVSSDGDQWAPTWGRDDVLYTGSDDGTNFSAIRYDIPVALGQLVGNDPYNLKGTTVSAMKDYREGEVWKRTDSYMIDGVLYKFIVSFKIGHYDTMKALQRHLFERGIYIHRSTYIGAGSEGTIRCAVYADHSREDFDELVGAIG